MGPFLGKASPCRGHSPSQHRAAAARGARWKVGCPPLTQATRAVLKPVSYVVPKVTKYHPALLVFVLPQPPAFLPCSDKERPGGKEGKHVFCLLLNNRGFCNTLVSEAASTRKGQNSVKPLWLLQLPRASPLALVVLCG